MESGLPLNISYSGTTVCSIVTSGGFQSCGQVRPDLSGAIHYPKTSTTLASNNLKTLQWFDPSVFSAAYVPGTTVPTWGDLGHNALRGPGRDNWNIAMFKTFAAGERLHLELRAESFNTWNHTQFGAPGQNGGISTAVFAGSTATAATLNKDAGKATAAFDPRVFQLGAKVIF